MDVRAVPRPAGRFRAGAGCRRLLGTLALGLVVSARATAETTQDPARWTDHLVWLAGVPYDGPWLAGPREAQTNVLALGYADPVPLVVEPGRRSVWDVDLGGALPIVAWAPDRSALPDRVPPGTMGWSFTMPVGFHSMVDLRDPWGPIVNTDYRFGFSAAFQWGLGRRGGASAGARPKRTWLGLRATLGHESSHIGDEYLLRVQVEHPNEFEHINITYQFLETALSVVVLDPSRGEWRGRLGLASNVLPRESYYQTNPLAFTISAVGPVTPGHDKDEWFAGLEYSRDRFAGSDGGSSFFAQWGWYAGTDLRWKAIYDYHRPSPDDPEESQLSVNTVAGLARSRARRYGFARLSPYARFYYGVNPHGQFRSQSNFTIFGLGLHFEP